MTSLDSAPERAGVSPPADISKPGDRVAQGATVHHGLQVTAAYAWRVIIVAAAVYLLFAVLAKLTLVAVAVFVGLVITACYARWSTSSHTRSPEVCPSR